MTLVINFSCHFGNLREWVYLIYIFEIRYIINVYIRDDIVTLGIIIARILEVGDYSDGLV